MKVARYVALAIAIGMLAYVASYGMVYLKLRDVEQHFDSFRESLPRDNDSFFCSNNPEGAEYLWRRFKDTVGQIMSENSGVEIDLDRTDIVTEELLPLRVGELQTAYGLPFEPRVPFPPYNRPHCIIILKVPTKVSWGLRRTNTLLVRLTWR